MTASHVTTGHRQTGGNMTGAALREAFLKFFEGKNHTRVESSSLVPSKEDATLLFTNAGMVQFKNVFTGVEKRPYSRATTAQKCLRVSGKHNDLENVGHTPRHHTFFEMMGNFSFGDYFKEDAIAFAWEFLTEVVALPKDRLHVTIYKDDDEADRIWRQVLGPRSNPIVRLGEKDNFWSMGDTGPCGPCSEIHYDLGPDGVGCTTPDCAPGCDCDRFLELWNLVFMQYERDATGNMTPLPKPSIDTGLGLERLAAVMQNKLSNWETDLFMPIIESVENIRGFRYGRMEEHDIAMRVIADHARAAAFLIADDVAPSNEGAGYVLRRLLRRAVRYAMRLGAKENESFLHEPALVAVEEMGRAYPELQQNRVQIEGVIKREEALFQQTLGRGEVRCLQKVQEAKDRGKSELSGEEVFVLYDTYGMPPDVVADIAKEQGLVGFDQKGFTVAMAEQKERSRRFWKKTEERFAEGDELVHPYQNMETEFTGYERLVDSGVIRAIIIRETERVGVANPGDMVEIVTDRTPFYGESGGQVGDHGTIARNGDEIEVENTIRPFPEVIAHRGLVKAGNFRVGDRVDLRVHPAERHAVMANHSATHLLQWALRQVLGDHVKQSGSLVEAGRLRFDFTHFSPISPAELAEVEDLVNEKVRANLAVRSQVMPVDEARAKGAIALFGEKYGETVRMVSMGDFSKELCGGTHAQRTGDIALFKIVSEGGIAAGVRRIEAVTGKGALDYVRALENEVRELGERLRGSRGELVRKLDRLIEERKSMERENQALKSRMASGHASDILEGIREIAGVKVLARRVDHVSNPKDLRDYADRVKDKLGSGVALLAAVAEDKVFLVAVVTKDLAKRFHAGDIVKKAAGHVGGSGGGRPDMAQAGGPDVHALEKALKSIEDFFE
jgi:alanyl-tRNA synthetase